MIYYFSGTGNTKWIAEQLAKELNEQLISIAEAMEEEKFRYTLKTGEKIGWVFPIYSWGPAPIVIDFIKKWHIDGYNSITTYCYMVGCCGDEVGMSVDIWRKALGFILGNAAFSVQMPNNYILLPGFDVDSHDVEMSKLRLANSRVENIARSVAERRVTEDVVEGSKKWLKSKIIYPLFKRYGMKDKPFNVVSDKCTHCGKCVENCPVHNIEMSSSSLPHWKGHCAMCLGCIHRCPTKAIQYGKQSIKKGRYYFRGT